MNVAFTHANQLVDEDYSKCLNTKEQTKRKEIRENNEQWWIKNESRLFRNFIVTKMGESVSKSCQGCNDEKMATVKVYAYLGNTPLTCLFCLTL
jgi:hypothetical protein